MPQRWLEHREDRTASCKPLNMHLSLRFSDALAVTLSLDCECPLANDKPIGFVLADVEEPKMSLSNNRPCLGDLRLAQLQRGG